MITIKKTTSDLIINDNNNNNNDDNIDITCISNAIVLVSISYQVDSTTATKFLAKTNNNNSQVKKRNRNDTKINCLDTEKVLVYIDKLDEGLFVVPNYNSNADDNEEVILKPLKEYTVYAD
jgi:Asp-tRNA(Asn)/Glu-tRNA(Gln) amidotransferase C subunit